MRSDNGQLTKHIRGDNGHLTKQFAAILHGGSRSTFARVRVNAHTDARTRFVIADRPQTIVCAFTLSLANVDLAVYGDLAVGRVLILNNPRVMVN